jgi:hypothetical protein
MVLHLEKICYKLVRVYKQIKYENLFKISDVEVVLQNNIGIMISVS